jgi:signal-transduction protein with cAMP-binding, CBS, and nucleotidyltransferase domain
MIDLLSLYHFIPSWDKKLFNSMTSTIAAKKEDYLLFDGDIQNELYLIKAGVAYLYDDRGPKLRVLDFAYNNRFCANFESFSDQSPSKLCIQCLTDSIIERISYDDLYTVCNESQAIERAYRLFLEKLLISVINRTIEFDSLSIEERFLQIMSKKPELFKLVPHKYIASYINVDSTNFSKLYNQYCVNNDLYYE